MSDPVFKRGDIVAVKPCMWPWHVGQTYQLYGKPFKHDDVPDGDEWWYYINPGFGSILPESVLELVGRSGVGVR